MRFEWRVQVITVGTCGVQWGNSYRHIERGYKLGLGLCTTPLMNSPELYEIQQPE